MKLAIIIATFDRFEYLKKLLIQINELTLPSDVKINIIIIIDNSTYNFDNLIKYSQYKTTIIKGTGNWWWTKSMNEGFKKAISLKQEYVLILNDDTTIEKDYLTILLNDYLKLPANTILGSASVSIKPPHKIESAGTKGFIKWRLKFIPYFKGFQLLTDHFEGVHETFTLSGRGTLIPISVFMEIGLYDEKLIQYGSDDEFIFRAKLKEIPVYISWNAKIYNNTYFTSKGSVFKKEGIPTLIKSFFNKYSVNSLYKNAYLYLKYSYKILLPIYLLIVIAGTVRAYYFNYKK